MMPQSSIAGPRAKRARIPKTVPERDTDGPMSITELSRLVRDFCRRYAHDREGWKDIVCCSVDHAKRLAAL